MLLIAPLRGLLNNSLKAPRDFYFHRIMPYAIDNATSWLTK